MNNPFFIHPQIQVVHSFQDLVSIPFQGEVNAMCWERELLGDFSEIVNTIEVTDNMKVVAPEELRALHLSEQGQLAREMLLHDLEVLKTQGASPILNIINFYDRDDYFPFFPTDVYSFHVDRSPIPVDTYLCTYFGASSEILPNEQALQKVLVPEIRDELKKMYGGSEAGFEDFLTENFFDLHYLAQPNARPISLGHGHLWRLAIDHPQSKVLPCVHRAPEEKKGEPRLLLIC